MRGRRTESRLLLRRSLLHKVSAVCCAEALRTYRLSRTLLRFLYNVTISLNIPKVFNVLSRELRRKQLSGACSRSGRAVWGVWKGLLCESDNHMVGILKVLTGESRRERREEGLVCTLGRGRGMRCDAMRRAGLLGVDAHAPL